MINTNQMEVVVITWGATIASLKCPDKYGHSVDIVLGFDDMKGIILILNFLLILILIISLIVIQC